MGASKDFPIIYHEFVPCTCDDPECRYCAECKEQECFHQECFHQKPSDSGLRDVPIDEVFTWREEFDQKAKEAFGGSYYDVNPQTYSDLKQRCDRLERAADPFFERVSPPVPLNGVHIHCVTDRMIPDGILRGCQCRTTERTYSNGRPILEEPQ